MSAMLTRTRRSLALALAGTSLTAFPSVGSCSPLPEALQKALKPISSTPLAPQAPARDALSPEFRSAIDAVARIKGDDDLKGVAALDVIDELLKAGHLTAARDLAEVTPGYRGAVAFAKVAQCAAESSQLALYETALEKARFKLEPFLRTRRGQIVQAHLVAAYCAAGDQSSADSLFAQIDLPEQKTLAEALCLSARANGGQLPPDVAVVTIPDQNILRPVYLKKAQAILDLVESSLEQPLELDGNARREKLIGDALRLAAGSRVNVAAVSARAAGLYQRMGLREAARALLAEATPLAVTVEDLREVALGHQLAGDNVAAGQALAKMRAAIPGLPVTLRAKACYTAARFAMESGDPELAEMILSEEIERSRANPNPRIAALADCYAALCYAGRDSALPDSIRKL